MELLERQTQKTLFSLEKMKKEEIHSINSTYYDSLNNIIQNSTIKENKNKVNNFYKALNSIRQKENKIEENINEFSEACVNLSKEEKIQKYLLNPLKKEIIKEGNNLIKISNLNNYNLSIQPIYSYNISNHIIKNYLNEENEKEKNTFKKYCLKNSTTANSQNENINNNNIEVKSFNLEVINDLDEIKDLNLEEYKNSQKKNFNDILILDSIFDESEKTNKKNILISTNLKVKYSNEKKLRQKFFRSDFKNKKIKEESILKYKNYNLTTGKNLYDKENSSIYSNLIIAKNLLNKFNSCSQKSELVINILENSSLQSNNYYINNSEELIDYLSVNNTINYEENNIKTPTKNFNIEKKNIFSTPKDKIKVFKVNSFISKNKEKNLNNSNSISLSLSRSNIKEENLEIQTIYDLEFYNNLLKYEKEKKKINPNYMKIYYPKINWEDRRKIINWIMEITEEFAFKRDTFHYSIYYFDLILSNENFGKEKNLNFDFLKLIAITCLSISAKIEEIQIPKLSEYIQSLENNSFEVEDIIILEKEIVNLLNWKIIPITINIWLNWYICQWDLFIETVDNIKKQFLNFFSEEKILFFKKSDDNSYYNFRKITQIIDLIQLDEKHFFFDDRYLIAASIFLLLSLNFHFEFNFEQKEIILQNEKIKKLIFNVYNNFIQQSFDYNFSDKQLIDSIKYVFQFKNFNFSFELPLIYQVEQKDFENGNYEDFITYQTYNEGNLEFLNQIYGRS